MMMKTKERKKKEKKKKRENEEDIGARRGTSTENPRIGPLQSELTCQTRDFEHHCSRITILKCGLSKKILLHSFFFPSETPQQATGMVMVVGIAQF
jgi:hypothetical protein